MTRANYWADSKLKLKVFFHHDNAPTHTFAAAAVKLLSATTSTVFSRFGDFFLFPHLKKLLKMQTIKSKKKISAATEAYFADLNKTYFSEGFKKSEHC